MSKYGLLISYGDCSGCGACLTACQAAHGSTPEQSGLKQSISGPFQLPAGKVETWYIPTPTAFCDRCAGKDSPACACACPFGCIAIGEIPALGKQLTKKRMALFSISE